MKFAFWAPTTVWVAGVNAAALVEPGHGFVGVGVGLGGRVGVGFGVEAGVEVEPDVGVDLGVGVEPGLGVTRGAGDEVELGVEPGVLLATGVEDGIAATPDSTRSGACF